MRDYQTSAPIGGARVTIGDVTATTDATGAYGSTAPAGQQGVVIDGGSIGTVYMRDRTYRGDFYVHVAGCIARYGTVIDRQTRLPVSGAAVSLNGPATPAATATDRAGWFLLNLGCPGAPCIGFNTVFVSITHPSYVNGSFIAGRGVCGVRRVDYELTPR